MLKGISIAGVIIGGIVTQNYLPVVCGVVSAIDMGVDYAIKQKNLNIDRRLENIGVSMANIRAGASGDRHSRATY